MQEPMRIIFVSAMNGWQWGGSEELWSQCAAAMKKAGDHVMVSVPDWPKKASRVVELEQLGVQVKTRQAGKDMRLTRRIRKALVDSFGDDSGWLSSFRPDLVVISQGYNSGGFKIAAACQKAEIPYIVIVHCNHESWWFGSDLDAALQCYTHAKRVFCVSERNLALLRLQLGEPALEADIVRNPFNVSCDSPPAWPGSDLPWRIACVARLELAAKGQDILLQTLALPEWRDRPIELNLYGSGPDESLLRKLIKCMELKSVNLMGHTHDVREIWAGNHILALPSRYEGLPLALVEAMWCARPAIVTDVGGNAELCVDGQTGFVAAAPNLASFSATLDSAWKMRNQWQEMGRTARTVVQVRIPTNPIDIFCGRIRQLVAS